MDVCEKEGGPVLCVSEAIVFTCSVCLWAVAVSFIQTWLICRRLRQVNKLRTAKSAIFYAVAMQSLMLSLQSWLVKKPEEVLHLLHDYSKFLLYTSLFYYFSMHTFQLVGNSRTAKIIIWTIAGLNVAYLSGFTSYLAYDLSTNKSPSSCKGEF